MPSRPREGPHAPVAVVDTSSWPRPCPCPVRAEPLLLLLGRWRAFGQSAGAFVEGRWVDSRMTGERTPKCLISKKIAVSTQLFVLVQYKQNKKSLL